MVKKFLLLSFIGVLVVAGNSGSFAAEKVIFSSGTKLSPPFYLPMFAAEERGFWKANGVEAEWVPVRGSARMNRAMETGAVHMAFSTAPGVFVARAGGGHPLILSEWGPLAEFYIWVPSKSRIRGANDMKGATVGTTQIGGLTYTYGTVVFKALGLEKDVRFVGTGGIRQTIAALKSGALDSSISAFHLMAELKLKGELREVIYVNEFLPKVWSHYVVAGNSKFIKGNRDKVRKVLKAVLQSARFIEKNPVWSVKKMMATSGWSEKTAKAVYDGHLKFTDRVKVNREGLENVRSFLIKYRLISKEKAPSVDEVIALEIVR